MSKIDAILLLIGEAYSERTSLTRYKRVLRAIKALDLNAAEACAVTHRLDYTQEDGHPYHWLWTAMCAETARRKEKSMAKARS